MNKMNDEALEELTNRTRRSKGQTLFLYELLKGDYLKLFRLEEKIKNCFVGYCPGDMDEVEKVLNMVDRDSYFSLRDMRTPYFLDKMCQ